MWPVWLNSPGLSHYLLRRQVKTVCNRSHSVCASTVAPEPEPRSALRYSAAGLADLALRAPYISGVLQGDCFDLLATTLDGVGKFLLNFLGILD